MPDYSSLVGNFLQGGGDANTPLRLRALQQQRAGELSDQAAQDVAADWGGPAQASTHADLLSRFMKLKGLEEDMNADPETGLAAQKRQADTTNTIGDAYLFDNPAVKHMRDEQLGATIKAKVAPIEATSAGNLAVEQAKAKSASELQQGEQNFNRQMMGGTPGAPGAASPSGSTSPGGVVPAPGSWKPSIGPGGHMSFTQTQTPAIIQRGYAQLSDAHSKTLAAIQDAERLYPGINAEAQRVDQGGAGTNFGSLITGVGAPKYGSLASLGNAALEKLKYRFFPTPYSSLAQESSFGNIEQMAGQLPAVRGISTLLPLFREHQARWGSEAPLSTVMRLRHMANIMEDSLHGIETGESNEGAQ